jgi:hypothetical protein
MDNQNYPNPNQPQGGESYPPPPNQGYPPPANQGFPPPQQGFTPPTQSYQQPYYGQPQQYGYQQPGYAPVPPPPPKKSNTGLIVGIILAVVLLVVVVPIIIVIILVGSAAKVAGDVLSTGSAEFQTAVATVPAAFATASSRPTATPRVANTVSGNLPPAPTTAANQPTRAATVAANQPTTGASNPGSSIALAPYPGAQVATGVNETLRKSFVDSFTAGVKDANVQFYTYSGTPDQVIEHYKKDLQAKGFQVSTSSAPTASVIVGFDLKGNTAGVIVYDAATSKVLSTGGQPIFFVYTAKA